MKKKEKDGKESKMARELPKWLTRQEDGSFLIDPDIAYPLALKALGVNEADATQFDIEVAYQCAKLATQQLITGTELDPRPALGFVMKIDSSGQRKERWVLTKFPVGKGIALATRGLEAKRLYPTVAPALMA